MPNNVRRLPVLGELSTRQWAAIALALLGLIMAVWATALNQRSAFAAVPAAPTLSPNRLPQSPDQVRLPPYPGGEQDLVVNRDVNLFTVIPNDVRSIVVRYTVQPGDSVFGIADQFGLQPETILWGNYEVLNDDPHMLRPGQELNILPLDGVYYQWEAGDTLAGVADRFQVDPREISGWPGNQLDPLQPQISAGDWVVIPGGEREFQQWFVPTIARGRAGVGTAFGPGGCTGDFTGGAVGTGGFIWPTANHTLSGNDYWSGHLAIDLAAGTGAPVWASDSGVVVFSGWAYGGYGIMVMIDHGNGWQTVYAHLSQSTVDCGASVSQGQQIGLAGSTGNSTGPHLHFEIRLNSGFVNPFFVLP